MLSFLAFGLCKVDILGVDSWPSGMLGISSQGVDILGLDSDNAGVGGGVDTGPGTNGCRVDFE